MEAVKRAAVGYQQLALCLEHFANRLVARFGMALRLGIGQVLVQKTDVQFAQAFDLRVLHEKPYPDQPDLVRDLASFSA